MPVYTLHIFDAIARDQQVLRETEEGLEVEYVSGAESDDSEYGSKRKTTSGGGSQGNRELVIHLFGSTATGDSVRVEVNGFRPFFYIEIPATTPTEESRMKMKLEDALKTRFSKQFSNIQTKLVRKKKLYGYTGGRTFPFIEISVPSQSLFYEVRKAFLDEDQAPRWKMPGTNTICKVYESNIDPMLRFFHLRNLQPCGWIQVTGSIEDTTVSADWQDIHPTTAPQGVVVAPLRHAFWDIETYSFDGEFTVAKQGYWRVAKQLWNKAASADDVPLLLQLAFAGNVQESFAMPPLQKPQYAPKPREITTIVTAPKFQKEIAAVWDGKQGLKAKEKEARIQELIRILDTAFGRLAPLAGDPIIQIGTTSWSPGQQGSEKTIFVLGGCAPLDGITVVTAKSEKDLLLQWFNWLIEQDFDVFVGYNIFGFDERYVWDRLCELGLEQEECVQQLTRLCDQGGAMKLEEKFLSSSALGDNNLYMWTTPGRLRIDLLGHVKRKINLGSYKLDSVAATFLSGKLGGVMETDTAGQWMLRTKQSKDARVGRYVKVLDELGEELSEKMRICAVTSDGLVVESEEDLSGIAGEAAKWAIVKDDVPPHEIFRLHRGSDEDRARVAAYCVQDCDLVLELYKKLEVFNEAMSMANVCSVPVSYIFTRGQGIKIESLIFKDCMQVEQLIQVLPRTNRGDVEDSYEGAIVLDPVPGFYNKAPVGVCDFASLYPSTIISENISHDMLVWAKDYSLDGKLLKINYGNPEDEMNAPHGTRFTDIEFDIWRPDPEDMTKNPKKVKVGVRVCRYAQPMEDVKGSLPTIVAKLLAARKAKRNEMGKTDDPFKKALLDAEQNAYKVTANSLYGQLGSATFKIRLQHLAASVTSYGRKQILFAKAAIETFYGPEAKDPRCAASIVYGDTDSIFVNFNPKNPETGEPYKGREAIVKTIELTEEAGKFVTQALKAPHDFEYDKVFYPFIIFSKKRYVGNKYEESPDEYKQTSMGISLKRRDFVNLLKSCYGGALEYLLNHNDLVGAVQCVKEKVLDLVEGRLKPSQIILSKSLKASYDTGTVPPHKMLADRIAARDPGNAPASGDRIEYVYIKAPVGQAASKLQGERIETPAYIKEKGLQIDAEYYIDHQLYNPLSQLFGILVEQMPGYVAPKSWHENPEKRITQREILAGDLLFKDALALCKKHATRNFVETMFGSCGTSGTEHSATNGPAKKKVSINMNPTVKTMPAASTSSGQSKQTTLSMFFKDTAVIDDAILARKMRAAKRATKEKKESDSNAAKK